MRVLLAVKTLWIWFAVLGAFALVSGGATPVSFPWGPPVSIGKLTRGAPGTGPSDKGGERLAELREQLSHKDASQRRRAVRDLAQLGGREAWEHVIGALADEKGEVADEAQFWLAWLEEERLVRGLFGREGLGSREGLVPLRVAEAFGRFKGAVDGDALLKKVSRRDAVLGEVLLWSVERLARRGKWTGRPDRCARTLEKLVKGGGPGTFRAQAACTLAAIAPGRAGELLPRWLGDREPALRRAALLCALEMELDSAQELGVLRVADEAPAVRLAALEAVAGGRNKRALELLVKRMELEPRFRLKVACVELLQELTGRKTKLSPRAWRGWVEAQPADWAPSTKSTGPGEVGGTVSFAGLPILSDRVCFLIDFSGSLWYEREGRPARKGKVDELVREALPRLPEGTRFNLMPYTGEPHPWRESLVEASPRHVQQAIHDFEANRERGSGNVFDAVMRALQDPATDRLVILTDGAPTGGARWKMELMVPLLVQATRFNGVAIDALVVDAGPGLRKHWFELAERTGGRALAVDL